MSMETERLLHQVQSRFMGGLEDTIAWFQHQMADYYYRVTSEAERARHVTIIHSLRHMPRSGLVKVDDNEAGKVLVFGAARADAFAEALQVVGELSYTHIEIHTTADRSLTIFGFVYRDAEPPADFNWDQHRDEVLAATCHGQDCIAKHVVTQYLDSVSDSYLARSSAERIGRHVRAWAEMTDPEQVFVADDDFRTDGKRVARVLIAARMSRDRYATLLADFLKRNDVYLERGYIDEVPAYEDAGSLLISTIYVTESSGASIPARRRKRLSAELLGLRRHFGGALGDLFAKTPYSQFEFQILTAAVDFSAQLLPLEHQFLDVRESGSEAMLRHTELCKEIVHLIDLRFGPKAKSAAGWQREYKRLEQAVAQTENLATATLLESMLRFVGAIQLTNVYNEQRLGQSFQLDPSVLPAEHFKQQPYGIFFFHGRNGMGFQVRFRASARGGLRLLIPRTHEQLLRYRNRLLAEVYDLAWAQQLKNKDIPEGGSKCIALISPEGDADSMVKQMADSLLDLIVPTEHAPDVRGPHGAPRQQQLIFLGPDENMTPPRIAWVAERAERRHLPHAPTLMSSKAGSGINHKEFGVTSEGVYVWMTKVLPLVGITDDQPWTMSMTGGPDGDVGGNLIKILYREQADRCRIVAIADGSGAAYDPQGLAWKPLLDLVESGSAIADFPSAALSDDPAAYVTAVDDRASEELRNTLHSTTRADLFVPCGGRPYTINDRNWQDMLDEDGQPRIRGMVEGANIFITATARERLEERGLISIKDSSANKGGVITSSYEILAGLICTDAEFMATKSTYVEQTLAILRDMAADEAQALLEAWNRRGRSAMLSHLSQAFSEEINRIATVFEPLVAQLREAGEFSDHWTAELQAHCPPILVERCGDRLHEAIPADHITAILTKRLASRMLYREGLTWCRSYVIDNNAEEVLRAYIGAQQTVQQLVAAIPDRDQYGIDDDIIAIGTRREMVRRQLGR